MYNLKKGKIFTLLFILLLSLSVKAYAETLKNYVSMETSYNSKSDLIMTPHNIGEVDLINIWESTIFNMGNGNVRVTGSTLTYYPVEEIQVTVELQRWNGSSWITIYTCNNKGYYDDYVFTDGGMSVARGQYYRVRGTHYAKNKGQSETRFSYTNPLFIQ
jgi:hypothetical protein